MTTGRSWRGRAVGAGLAALAVLLSSCIFEEDEEEPRVVDVAAGALWPVSIGNNCDRWPLCVELTEGEVLDASVGDSDVIEVRDLTGSGFTIVGREPGTTSLAVRADVPGEGETTRRVTVQAWAPEHMWLRPYCTLSQEDDPIYLPPETEIRFSWVLRGEGSLDLPGYAPFDVGSMEEVALDMVERNVTWRTPAAPGQVEIRCSVLDDVVRTIEVYETSRVDGVDVGTYFDRPIEVGRRENFYAVPLIGADRVCLDGFERDIELGTPDLCSLSQDLDVWSATTTGPEFDVYGRAPGMCEITVSLVGTEVSATLEVRVVESD